eukprot:2835390-Amphidinium_carterae.1
MHEFRNWTWVQFRLKEEWRLVECDYDIGCSSHFEERPERLSVTIPPKVSKAKWVPSKITRPSQ